ncbi:putative membrane protein [Burkholderia phage Maja]|uniref:Putative membrane protein n=1 Tax=Burkholderia phage Maja TaxID=2767571 RepID=A0A7S6U088_9CAUD|nr:putative membrane protein [Burkholderia phage Maja]
MRSAIRPAARENHLRVIGNRCCLAATVPALGLPAFSIGFARAKRATLPIRLVVFRRFHRFHSLLRSCLPTVPYACQNRVPRTCRGMEGTFSY